MDNFEYTSELMNMPVIPLRGLVVFPEMVLHFDVGRKKSVAALKSAMNANQQVFLVAQRDAAHALRQFVGVFGGVPDYRDAAVDDPNIDDLYSFGVICKVKQLIKIPNSENIRVVVEGVERGTILAFSQFRPYIVGAIEPVACLQEEESKELKAYIRAVKKEFEKYAEIVPKISNDVKVNVISINDGSKLCDFICSNSFIDYEEKQEILEAISTEQRLAKLLVLLKKENSVLEIEAEIHDKVHEEIDKNQREYYLREELKVISESLGDGENPIEEADAYRHQIKSLVCSDSIKDKLLKECNKLMKMPSGSHEGTVVRNYLDKCLEIPFGVGKTSIVKSLAKSMNRKYIRIALGGVHDEAEIRGHRKPI